MRSLRCLHTFLSGFLAGFFVRRHLDAVDHVDLPRFMGSWRVIGLCDNPVERHFADTVESYRHRGDGHIAVEFRWRDGDVSGQIHLKRFTARVTDRFSNARWRVSIPPFLAVRHVIIALDEKYRWAAIAHPSRRFGWILARGSTIPDGVWKDLLDVFREQGYDPATFIRIPQPPGLAPAPSSIAQTPT